MVTGHRRLFHATCRPFIDFPMTRTRTNKALLRLSIVVALCAGKSSAFEAGTMFSVGSVAARRCFSQPAERPIMAGALRLARNHPTHLATRCLSASNSSANNNSKSKRKKPQVPGKAYRADRVLSNRGWGSRAECFEILKQRRVFQKFDDGVFFPVLGPSEKISMDADIWIDHKVQVPLPPPLLRVYHKPKWVLSVMNDGKGRKNLSELDFIHNMHPVGRLDYDTSGLLLFSSDGSLTQTLLHPSNEIQKEYVALVVGAVNEEDLRKTLEEGVETSMGAFPANLVEANPIPEDQVKPLIDDILNNLPPEYELDKLEEKGYLFFKDATELSEVRLVVEEGKHRMIRRILANSGYPVIGLKRERLGAASLDDLEPGQYRELTEKELQWAESLRKRKPKQA